MTFPRIRRDLTRLGLPPLQITSKARTKRAYDAQRVVIDDLVEDGQVEALRAIVERRVSLEELVDAKRRGELGGPKILTNVALNENLWEAFDKQIPKMGKSIQTRKRYAQSRRSLEAKAGIPKGAKVNDLVLLDWSALQSSWGNSASDWMHVRRFVSTFLTKQLGDVYHPFRRSVVSQIPTATEVERVPDLTPEVFWKIIEAAPEHARPAYVTLVLTGMRRGEYLRCTREHLKPGILAVSVPGSKTRGSSALIYVAEGMWPWVDAGIPSPLRYKRLRETWKASCEKTGVTDIHLHDLRHCMAQWATNEGVPQVKIQDAMRHSSPAMTNKYSRQKAKGEVANAISKALHRKGA